MADCAKRNKRYDIQDRLDNIVDEFLNVFLPYLE